MTDQHYPFYVATPPMLPLKLLPPFAPGITAPHPPGDCQCAWAWTPSRGGKDKPFAMKYWNRACTVRHQFPHPAR